MYFKIHTLSKLIARKELKTVTKSYKMDPNRMPIKRGNTVLPYFYISMVLYPLSKN
jgi:hypothetical protein